MSFTRQSKTPQKWPVQKSSVDQKMHRGSGTYAVIRPGYTSSVDKVQLEECSPMQPPRTKSNGPTDITTSERNPTDQARTRVKKKTVAGQECLISQLITWDWDMEEAKTIRYLCVFSKFILTLLFDV